MPADRPEPIVELVRDAIGNGVLMVLGGGPGLIAKLRAGDPGASFAEALTGEAEEFVRIRADLVEAVQDSLADMSNVSIDGRRQTYRQLYARELADRQRLEEYRRMLADLSRNENGRHEGDADVGVAGGVSQGNPHLKTGDVIGYSLGGAIKYVVPEPQLRRDIDAWKVRDR